MYFVRVLCWHDVCMFACVLSCFHAMCMPRANNVQKSVSDILELAAMWALGIRPRSSEREAISPAPQCF